VSTKQGDIDLVTKNLALVEGVESAREAARKLRISPQKVLEWRAGTIKPLRTPMRNKLSSNLGERTPEDESGSLYTSWDPMRLLEILDRESRAAESRARESEISGEAAKERAVASRIAEEAARERAMAARIAEENARDLRRGMLSLDPEAQMIGDQAIASIDGEDHPETIHRPPGRRHQIQPRAQPRNDGS